MHVEARNAIMRLSAPGPRLWSAIKNSEALVIENIRSQSSQIFYGQIITTRQSAYIIHSRYI